MSEYAAQWKTSKIKITQIWQSEPKYAGKATVKTWLFTIARNKLVDRTCRDTRVAYTDALPEIEDNAPNPEAVMASLQEAGRVRACLNGLKDTQRAIMRMACFDGLTYAEIAAVEDIPKGTVKTRVMHAKQALLKCLGYR